MERSTPLDPNAHGLAYGVVYAVFLAVWAWVAALFPRRRDAVALIEHYYPGYTATPQGGLLGALYGFFTGFPLGWGVAQLYNVFLPKGTPAAEAPPEAERTIPFPGQAGPR